jgi:hypothetical protein
MAGLIVVQIVPDAPVDPVTFQTDYLTGLKVEAFDLSFATVNATPPGASVGSASFIPPNPSGVSSSGVAPPTYPAGVTNGIIQQVDFVFLSFLGSFDFESVAVAIIDVSGAATKGNFRLEVSKAGKSLVTVPDLYDCTLVLGPVPNPATFASTATDPNQISSWAALTPQAYVSIPAASNTVLKLPQDGTPPPFDPLMAAVQGVLGVDPGVVAPIATAGPNVAASKTVIELTSVTTITVGMTASAGAGGPIPAGTTVVAIDTATKKVTLSQELTAALPTPTNVTFAWDLATLTFAQCRNVAEEIVWAQQSPLPTPADPIEDLYTDPPNTGHVLGGTSGTTPNQFENDRQQFEGQLRSYYAVAGTTANQLATYVYALSAAVACEQQSVSQMLVMLELPAHGGGGASSPDTSVILTGVADAGEVENFGVPAAYFYALAATMPPQITVAQRYSRATGDQLSRLLSDLTTAVNAGTVTDAEPFSQSGLTAVKINAAQAARRLVALGVLPGSATALAPLGAVAQITSQDASSGSHLRFTSLTGLATGMRVSGPGIAPGATVSALGAGDVTLSAPIVDDVPVGSAVYFAPAYGADLKALVKSWLAYPPTPSGAVSSDVYQPGDDAANLWPAIAAADPGAFLNLMLGALTQGYVIPDPFGEALGSEILKFLAGLPNAPAPLTLAFLASVTVEQWTQFFQQNPTWLPPFTAPGNTAARIAAFITAARSLFSVASSGPSSAIVLATKNVSAAGAALSFASTAGVVQGMNVSGAGVPPAATVTAVTATSVSITPPVGPAGVAAHTNITFTPGFLGAVTLTTNGPSAQGQSNLHFASTVGVLTGMTVGGTNIPAGAAVSAVTATQVTLGAPIAAAAGVASGIAITFTPGLAGGSGLPRLQTPSIDWLESCLAAYGAFTFGTGLDPAKLGAAAVSVFPDDPEAQAWLVGALTAIDALYQVTGPLVGPLKLTAPAEFSLVEALYARGFRSAADITELDGSQFSQAVLGTVAYPPAASIYAQAATLAPPQPQPQPGAGFKPVNDGSLTDCIPAPCASPLGPIAYLCEMLQVSALSRCDAVIAEPISLTTSQAGATGGTVLSLASTAGVFAGMSVSGSQIVAGTTVTAVTATSVTLSQPLAGTLAAGSTVEFAAPSLGAVLSSRRGPLGELTASCANLEIPLPLIDLVNECLEYLGASAAPAGGTVYDTSPDEVADHLLCVEVPCHDDEADQPCHEPERLLGALPEYSTPATPVGANAAVEPAVFNKLKADFSCCQLPYSQALDVSRTYLRHLGSCRYEEMRTFRKCIREFVLDPAADPPGFQSWLWRYPVRIDIAIEYLGITPEEYATVFQGAPASPCSGPVDDDTGGTTPVLSVAHVLEGQITVPAFLAETCLSYCEFYELWQSGFVTFSNGATSDDGVFPQCEPCCLDELWLLFDEDQQQEDLQRLLVFVRLWRKLRESCCFCYSFAQLRDICDVLQLYSGGALNPDFVRQLAAFQMLREDFRLELTDKNDTPAPNAVDADRTHLLALWVGTASAKWSWAVQHLIERIEEHAIRRHHRERRSPEDIKLLAANLDPLSALAGFDPDPASPADWWHALPTHTLRFTEVLAKIYASDFTVGELIYLFTAEPHLDGDDPFPLQEENDALDVPLGLPDEEREFSLWRLRRQLLETKVGEDEGEEWPWRQIEHRLQAEFGFPAADVLALGQHFFPEHLIRSGTPVDAAARRFTSGLAPGVTSAATWNTPPDGPFLYDPVAGELSAQLPLDDREVIHKLTRVHQLNPNEQTAVQDLMFQPRALLARFALLFEDFATAQRRLIEERQETERFAFFQAQFILCWRRCHMIARHLTDHVAVRTGQREPDDVGPAALILRAVAADENAGGTSWEADSGVPPTLTWTPPPIGGALAALLGLCGTGLTMEIQPEGGGVVWRDGSGALSGFGETRNHLNCPVPAVLPSLGATLTPQQLQFASVTNGLLMKDATGEWLGGAQGFTVTWSGALLVEQDGTYEFWAGAPTPDHEHPDFEAAEHRQWRVVLNRGQRTWVILSHDWPGESEHRSSELPLRPGAYELTVEFRQPDPEFANDEQVRRQHTGFQVKYCGPDTHHRPAEIPHRRLFALQKEAPLGAGIENLSPGAAGYLATLYRSSLRDIRRTYQRAFKAVLFVHRFALSAEHRPQGTSELGYMLADPAGFAGSAYYRSGGGFAQHAAEFDFDLLPLLDAYRPPAQDARTNPSPQRVQAMFDWWERIFDYTVMRRDVHRRTGRHVWHLFEEAHDKQPPDPANLLRHLGADARHWKLELRYFQGQQAVVYDVTSADLTDDRWTVRAWHADRWLRALRCCFAVKDITVARPDLWGSDDPSATLPAETETGNANLSALVCDGCIEQGDPRRYKDLKRLNDGLRERGRDALVAYLCQADRVRLPWLSGQFATVPRDLSDLLLLDVEAGIPERASRIEEAITAVQTYVRRARLGLEPGWPVLPAFTRLWDREFASFHVWQACKRRQLYKENWVEWDELGQARDVEAFRFLEDRLRDLQLTVPQPGGLEWWPDPRVRPHGGLELLQAAEASGLRIIPSQPEGLGLLGTPDRAATPSWLAPVAPKQEHEPPSPPRGDGEVPQAITLKAGSEDELPYWLRTAIRLGTRFWRIDAAGLPPAANTFAAYPHRGGEDCVTCCDECGCEHPAALDEFYFWLVDGTVFEPPVTPTPTGYSSPPPGSYQDGYQTDFYDPAQQEAALWQDPTQLPVLLQWQGSPVVRLAWCRVHNGVFQQPRRSVFGVEIKPGTDAELDFLGRTADSLTFSVHGGIAPDGYLDLSVPGFRYDMAVDEAMVLPQVIPPGPPPTFLGGQLPAYPYFVYFAPGKPLFPISPFAPAVSVARVLRAHCRYEAALRWYRLAFDPLDDDDTWIECPDAQSPGPTPPSLPDVPDEGGTILVPPTADVTPVPVQEPPQRHPTVCCDSTDISCAQARNRAVLLLYVETLVEWGDALRRRGNSPEAFQQARVVFDAARLILGPPPRKVRLTPPANPPTVTNFTPEFAPINPRLLDLYEIVADRLALTHAAINACRLREGRPGTEMPYFGNSPLREGWRTAVDPCPEEWDWCLLPSPYRFTFLIQKALEYAARAEQLGGALLAAYEKGDAECLQALRANHEHELLVFGLEAKKDQWRDADWQVEALQTGKSVSQANLAYTNGLINAGPLGLINGEIQYQDNTASALSLRSAGNVIEGVGEAMQLIPDMIMGVAGFGGSPVDIFWIPLGTKIGQAMQAIARIMNNSAEIDTITAGLDETDASWLRRFNEWQHQAQVLTIEIHQAEQQILAAQRRRDQALRDLNAHRHQIDQTEEIKNFLRDKFTAHDLYLFLQSETLALYRQTYDLARYAARQAECAFNLERGHQTRRFIPDCAWEDLREGLLAGERLSSALRHMEKAFLDEDVREYELTKNISLRLQFPWEFLRLRTTGRCEIEIPEWMFDVDGPGMYMRRIKSVSLTIPCVTGPYTGVHCRLTLIGSTTRIDPTLRAPAHECCCPPEPCRCEPCREHGVPEYELCPDDPRAVRQYDARQAIATSSGQSTGLFELRFEDPRYLPFEYMGAVSRWRIELPRENNYFDFDSLTDVVIQLNYTAREGGELLRRAANASGQRHLPGDGWHIFDVRHEFPDAWQLFRSHDDERDDEARAKRLKLTMTRRMFPFIPGDPEIRIDQMAVLFGVCGGIDCDPPSSDGCPCPERRQPAVCEIDYIRRHGDDHTVIDVPCFAGERWPDMYCGLVDADLGPLDEDERRRSFELRFPNDAEIERVFLLCRYRADADPDRPPPRR